jgi:micrococcal nuclease
VKHTFTILLPFLSASLGWASAVSAAVTPQVPPSLSASTYTVESCNDGDTCKLKTPDNISIKVRLVGIDAPEFKGDRKKTQPMAAESKDFLNKLVKGKSVRLHSLGTDGFNRNLAEIYVGDTNANLELVKNGLAEVYRGRPPKGFNQASYEKAEAEAKSSKKGIWSLEKYESPKDFRKRMK